MIPIRFSSSLRSSEKEMFGQLDKKKADGSLAKGQQHQQEKEQEEVSPYASESDEVKDIRPHKEKQEGEKKRAAQTAAEAMCQGLTLLAPVSKRQKTGGKDEEEEDKDEEEKKKPQHQPEG
eukprot:s132_g5.t1